MWQIFQNGKYLRTLRPSGLMCISHDHGLFGSRISSLLPFFCPIRVVGNQADAANLSRIGHGFLGICHSGNFGHTVSAVNTLPSHIHCQDRSYGTRRTSIGTQATGYCQGHIRSSAKIPRYILYTPSRQRIHARTRRDNSMMAAISLCLATPSL